MVDRSAILGAERGAERPWHRTLTVPHDTPLGQAIEYMRKIRTPVAPQEGLKTAGVLPPPLVMANRKQE